MCGLHPATASGHRVSCGTECMHKSSMTQPLHNRQADEMTDSNCEVPRKFDSGQVASLTLYFHASTLILVNLTRTYMVPHIRAQLRSCRNAYLRVAQGNTNDSPGIPNYLPRPRRLPCSRCLSYFSINPLVQDRIFALG